MASDIEQILYPKLLTTLRENISPVTCIVWKGLDADGNDAYEIIELKGVYPFDTIDTLKRMIYAQYRRDRDPNHAFYLPRFLFMGVPLSPNVSEEEEPDLDETYHPVDYLWYPMGTNDATKTYALANPRRALTHPDMRFISADGSYASPNHELRGRSSIEDVFLKPRNGTMPVFHVFPLHFLLQSYRGPRPMSEEDWNKRFAPYFLASDVPAQGPYEATEDDMEFGAKIVTYLTQRNVILHRLQSVLERDQSLPHIKLTGVRQMMLTWDKPVKGFEGCASMFYQIAATEQRPYLRLLPAEGSAITKLHVKGILPIPSLDDPRVIEVWSKEPSPTPAIDFCTIKYIHRPATGTIQSMHSQPVYGTIQVLNDGTINLQLQPPKQMRRLEPIRDFRKFNTYIQEAFEGLPQSFQEYDLKEISVIFSLKNTLESKRITKKRLLERLPYFSTFFYEIASVPDDHPIMSLRYKAVSQYASEDKVFTFITQTVTEQALEGEVPDMNIIMALQNEFQFSKKEAMDAFAEWLRKNDKFTVQLPKEEKFVESFHPGIDIHVYAQHPLYYFHVNRINGFETYRRIYTLLSLLCIEDDQPFQGHVSVELSRVEDVLQRNSEANESKEEVEQVRRVTLENDGIDSNEDELGIAAPAMAAPMAAQSAVPSAYLQDPFASNDMDSDVMPAATSSASTHRPIAAVAAMPAAAARNSSPVHMATSIDINPNNWFITKLQQIDPRLFSFKVDVQENVYSRKCAANDDRQPVVMTRDQFERMKAIYENDPVFWILYPLEGTDEPVLPIGTKKPIITVTIMRYGSDADNMQYYFCPHYYCLYDELMVIEEEFNGTHDRHGHTKPPHSCPFCHGKLITNRKKAETGHTVVKRKDKKGSVTYHKYIDFMKKSTHPENFALPCCFIKQSTLRSSDPQFSHLREYLKEQAVQEHLGNEEEGEEGEEGEEEREEKEELQSERAETEEYDQLVYKGEDAIEYAVLFETMHKRYIIESNKPPTPGIFAIAPAKFDTYFQQNSTRSIITRVAIHLKLQPTAQGFLRIGTQNTVYESLLGVIAPLVYKNTIQEVKDMIKDVVTPRIFINTHFGNLVLEFYNPADGSAMPATRQELMSWSQKNLGIALNSANVYALLRIYNSYKRFIRFIDDPTQRKDLRHIQPLLAEPELLTTKGIQLIVMEDEDSEEAIRIRCPTFGVSMDRHKTNDMVFISRRLKDIGTTGNSYAKYELYIHTSNKPAKGGEAAIHEHIIKWDYASQRIWPAIVKQRIHEYIHQCQSRYRSLYTSQQGIHPMAMVPLSKVMDVTSYKPEGIIKDNYNHIVAITFRSKPGSRALVALPVVDDGMISISAAMAVPNIHLDWSDYQPAAVEDVVRYYKTHFEPLFSLYPGYTVKSVVRQKSVNIIVAIQLANGIYIPVAPPQNEKAMKELGISMVEIEQLEWEIDKQLAGISAKPNTSDWSAMLESTTAEKRCGTDSELTRDTTYADFEEQYQQFRLMVSNWIVSHLAGSEIKKGLEEIIFHAQLPEYERRKRLYIFIAPTLLSWFYLDRDHQWSKAGPTSFLRKDCRVIDTAQGCTGSCYWKADEEQNDSGRCLLHVNDTTTLHSKEGSRRVNTSELYTKRIIDELVRFPNRRKQLMMKDGVSKISTAIKAIRSGDQYIIPESSMVWTNLLRLDWAKQLTEEPKYYEEMSAKASHENGEEPKDMVTGEPLPAELSPLFGDASSFRIKIPSAVNPQSPLLPFTSLLGITLEELDATMDATKFTKENLIKYVSHTSKPIGYIDTTEEQKDEQAEKVPTVLFVKPMRGTFDSVTIFVFLEGKVGILVEQEGESTVTIRTLPPFLQEAWKSAGVVQRRRATVAPVEMQKPVVLIGQKPIMAVQSRVPLLATTTQTVLRKKPAAAPFVEPDAPRAARRKPAAAPFVEPNASSAAPRAARRKPAAAPFVEPNASSAAPAEPPLISAFSTMAPTPRTKPKSAPLTRGGVRKIRAAMRSLL